MSLTLVTEMLRTEIKNLAMHKGSDLIGTRKSMTPDPHFRKRNKFTVSQENLSDSNAEVNVADASHDHMADLLSIVEELNQVKESYRSAISSNRSSHASSAMQTPDIPCINLISDLQSSLQQLGLLVEMGLVLGKITSGMAVLADGTYDSIQCDVVKVYEKVRNLTQRLGRSQNVVWTIDTSILKSGKHFSHPDVLLFVLISCLSQLLPHADHIRVKASFLPIEEVKRYVEDERVAQTLSSVVEVVTPSVIVGKVGMLLTEMEIYGDPGNLREIVTQLHVSNGSNDVSTKSGTSSENSEERDSNRNVEADKLLDADVEEFGGSMFALGSLLENVLGGSSYILTNTGVTFSFSIPCRVEADSLFMLTGGDMMESASQEEGTEASDSGKNPKSRVTFEDLPSSGKGGDSPLTPQSGTNAKPNEVMNDVSVYTKENVIKAAPETDGVQVVSLSELTAASLAKLPQATNPFLRDSMPNLKDLLPGTVISKPYKRNLEVLVVDDSLTVQKVMGIWLKKKNCEVNTALNGAIALDMMKKKSYDMVFLDFLMPVMDGITCLKNFREWCSTAPLSSLPEGVQDQWIVGLSATALKADQQDAFSSGLHMFCSKPVDMVALTYVIEAKKMGLEFGVLSSLAGAHRASSLSAEQQDLTAEIMVPPDSVQLTASADASPDAKSEEQIIKSKAKCTKDRAEAKAGLQYGSSGMTIFGSFAFNPDIY